MIGALCIIRPLLWKRIKTKIYKLNLKKGTQMRRIYLAGLTLFLCVLLGSCAEHSAIAPAADTHTDHTPSSSTSSIPADSFTPTANVSTAYRFGAPALSYEEQEYLDLCQVDIPEKINESLLDIIGMYNENTLLVYLSADTPEEEMQEVGLYHIFNGEYKKLFDVAPDIFAEICLWTDRYVIYRRTDINHVCRLYYHEIDTAESRFLYEYDAGYLMSSLGGRAPMLYNNAIFFDDTISVDGTVINSKIMRYDLESHSLEVFLNDAQFPFLYRGEPYYIMRRNVAGDAYEFTIKAMESDSEIVLTDRLHRFSPSNSALYSLENLSTNHTTKTTTWGIIDIVTGEELLSTDNTIGELASNEYFVTWWNYLHEYPVIYCVERDEFVIFDHVRKSANTVITHRDTGLLISLASDNNEYYYFSLTE